MPRKSTVEELQSEEPAAGSPVRRSSRLVTGNGTTGAQRSAQATEPPARITRARRASEEVETKPAPRSRRGSILADEEQTITPVRRGRKPSVTKESEDLEEAVKLKPVRGRRVSNASVEESEPQKVAAVRTRRSSANLEAEPVAAKTPGRRRSSVSEIVVEETSTPAKRATRGRKNSDVEIVEESKPATRGRRKSITQEEVEEKKPAVRRGRRTSTDSLASDAGPGTPSRRVTRSSSINLEEEVVEINDIELSPVIKDVSVRITPFKKRGIIEQVEAELDLSIINESDDALDDSKSTNIEVENKQESPNSRKRLSTINEIGTPPRKSPRLSEKNSPNQQRVSSPTVINLDSPENTSTNDSLTQKSKTIIEEKLNTSTESVGSNKENITINEILEKSVQVPAAFSARVSNVFKPNQKEYSFMEPMEVDQTINQSLVTLDKSLVATDSPLAKEKIVDDQEQIDCQEKPVLKKLSVILYNSKKIRDETFSPEKDKLKSVTRSEDSDLIDFGEADRVEEIELDESLVVFGEEAADSSSGTISVRVIDETEVDFLQPKEEIEETCPGAAPEANLIDLKEEVEIKEEIEEAAEFPAFDGAKAPTEASKTINEDLLVINEVLEDVAPTSSPADNRRKSLRKSKTPQARNSLQKKDEDTDKLCNQIRQKTPQKLVSEEVEEYIEVVEDTHDLSLAKESEEIEEAVEFDAAKASTEAAKTINEDLLVINEVLEDVAPTSSPADNRRKSLRKSKTPQARKSLQKKDEDADKLCNQIRQKTPQKLVEEYIEVVEECSEAAVEDTHDLSLAKESEHQNKLIEDVNKAGEIETANEKEEQRLAEEISIRKLEVSKELFDDSEDEDVDVVTSSKNKSGEIENISEDGKQASENEKDAEEEIETARQQNIMRKLEVSKELFDDSEDEDVNTNKSTELEKVDEDEKQASEDENGAVEEIELTEETVNKSKEVEKELFDDSEDENDDNINQASEDMEQTSKSNEIDVAEEEQVSENVTEAVEEIEVAEEAKEQAPSNENNKTSSKCKRSLDEFASTKLAEYFESKSAYVENSSDEEESENNEDDNSFIDGMAEEGEEDTPSEDSNQIIDQGESIGSSDSVDDEQSTDEVDSFICDDEESMELLSGEEYDLDIDDETKKKSRILNNEQFGDEEIIKMPQKKEKPKRILTRIITVSSSSEEEDLEVVDLPVEENIQDNEDSKSNVEEKVSIDEEATERLESVEYENNEPTDEQNDSQIDDLRRSLNALNQSRHRKSSLSIQENIFVDGTKDPRLSQRISSLVESFCSNVKKGEVSLNLSLEFEDTAAEEEENTGKSVNILSNVTIQKATDEDVVFDEQEDVSEAGPSEVENIVNQPEEVWENIEAIIPTDDSENDELNKSAQPAIVDLREVINKKLKRRLSKSLSEVYEETKKAKKRKKNNGKAKPRPDLTDYLEGSSFGLMNQLITDVKNRPRRKIKPTSSAIVNEAWTSTVISNLKPSTSVLKEEKKPVPKPKLHPKDFKNQLLTDPKRVKRVETKTLLRKKGAFF